MKYHIIYDRVRKVLDSCQTKRQLAIGEDYCLKLVDREFPYSLIRNRKRYELTEYVKGRSHRIRNFLM